MLYCKRGTGEAPFFAFYRNMEKIKKIKKKLKKISKLAKKKPEETLFLALAAMSLVFTLVLLGNIGQENVFTTDSTEIGNNANGRLATGIKKMVADYPIEKMVPYIARQDGKTAAYLVAIAKKESDWGKYSPQKRSKKCYNYWGYRGTYNRNAAGYSCFDSPAQAVNVVGNRIRNLIAQKVDTPREMVLWKCGSACTARTSPDAAKWVSDVNMYYKKVYD